MQCLLSIDRQTAHRDIVRYFEADVCKGNYDIQTNPSDLLAALRAALECSEESGAIRSSTIHRNPATIMSEDNGRQQAQIEEITALVKAFILDTILPGEDPSALESDTPLISSGIMDSISTLKLVTYLEEEFEIRIQASEMNANNLDTLTEITSFVLSKK